MDRSIDVFQKNAPDLSVEGMLLDIDKFSVHDGPGIRTTIFLKGCPLSCVWCHSPESQSVKSEIIYQNERCTGCWLCLGVCPEKALSKSDNIDQSIVVLNRDSCTACGLCLEVCFPKALRSAGRITTVAEVISIIEKDKLFFQSSGGGMTLSGGEPARQAEFSYNLLLACQDLGIHTALETTGYARWQVISALAEVTDLLLYDVKFINSRNHRELTGVPNQMILKNLELLVKEGHEVQVRVPCIPGINDSAQQLEDIAATVADMGVANIVLLPYNSAAGAKYEWIDKEYGLAQRDSQDEKYMLSLSDICHAKGLKVTVGG